LFDSRGGHSYTPGVQKEILAAFIDAIGQVLGEMDMPVDAVDEADTGAVRDCILSSVGLTGEVKGILMLRTDAASSEALFRSMTGGFGVTVLCAGREKESDEMRMAAFGELSNQVSGRAITLLWEKGVRCDITAPAVIAAAELRSLVPDLPVRFQRTVRGPFGRLTMFLGMQDDGPRDQRKKTS
jgi:CheY-specific phosphatase CheX